MEFASHSKKASLVYAILYISMWLGWLLFLSGTAASQQACQDNGAVLPTYLRRNLLSLELEVPGLEDALLGLGGRRALSSAGRSLVASVNLTCSTEYSFAWWIVWFQFLLTATAMVLGVNVTLRDAVLPALLMFFVIETTLLMNQASSFNNANVLSVGKAASAAGAGLAGCIILLLANMAFLICTTSRTLWSDLVLGGRSPSSPGSPPVGTQGQSPVSQPSVMRASSAHSTGNGVLAIANYKSVSASQELGPGIPPQIAVTMGPACLPMLQSSAPGHPAVPPERVVPIS